MTEGQEINERLEFKKRISELPPEERSIEVALMVYDLNEKVCQSNGFSKRGTFILTSTISIIMMTIAETFRAILHSR
jgi:hypothetical protein